MAEENDAVVLAEPQAPPPEDPPTADPAPRQDSRRWPLVLVAMALLAAGGFAAAWYDVLKLRGEDPVPALQAQVAELQARLDKADQTMADLASRLGDPAATAEALTALGDRLDQAEGRLEAMASAPANADGSIPPASFAALSAEVEALKSALAGQKDSALAGAGPELRALVDQAMADWQARAAAQAQAEVEATRARVGQLEAAERIKAAALTGAPYAADLAALGGVPVDAILRDRADTGLPTLTALAGAFPQAARDALDAALRVDAGTGGWSDGLFTFLRIQSGARSLTPREGGDPDAILSRAEAAVAAGQIDAALAEIAALPAEGQAAMQGWVAQAQDYQAVQQALAALSATLQK
ncbi:MAG: hypothetical protein R3D63_15090 [Paracoccaceae bacterium]